MEDADVTQWLNNSISSFISKLKSVNPAGYTSLAVKTDVGANQLAIIDGEILSVLGSSVHSGTAVATIAITFSETGYDNVPAITFIGGGGSGATATATISGSAITAITIVDGGSGYTSPPTVVITSTVADSVSPESQAIATLTAGSQYRRPASEISFELSELAKDSTSMHFQSKFNPAYYRIGRSVGIVPEGGEVVHINIPTTAYDADNIYGIAPQYEDTIIIGASIQAIERHMVYLATTQQTSYDETELSIPSSPTFNYTLPDNLVAPTLEHDAVLIQSLFEGQAVSRVNIDTSFPIYTPPTLTVPVYDSTYTPDDLELPDAPTAPPGLSVSLNFTD